MVSNLFQLNESRLQVHRVVMLYSSEFSLGVLESRLKRVSSVLQLEVQEKGT